MASTTPAKRPSRVPGAKILITASALAATLAGWAALTWKGVAPSVAAAPGLGPAEAQLAAAGFSLQPLPTLLPGSATSSGSGNPVWVSGGSQPVLRSVSAPPAPVTVTQSSRP